jgi:hypothetical protein
MIDDLVQRSDFATGKDVRQKIWIPSVLKIRQALQNHFCC